MAYVARLQVSSTLGLLSGSLEHAPQENIEFATLRKWIAAANEFPDKVHQVLPWSYACTPKTRPTTASAFQIHAKDLRNLLHGMHPVYLLDGAPY